MSARRYTPHLGESFPSSLLLPSLPLPLPLPPSHPVQIYIWQFKDKEITAVAFIDTDMYIHTVCTLKNFILIADVMKNIKLLRYRVSTLFTCIASPTALCMLSPSSAATHVCTSSMVMCVPCPPVCQDDLKTLSLISRVSPRLHTRKHTCTDTHTHTNRHTCTHTHTHTCTHTQTYRQTDRQTDRQMYTRTHTHTRTHTLRNVHAPSDLCSAGSI